MHACDTPQYDALIMEMIGATAGGRQLDAKFWCAFHGHTFQSFDGFNISFLTAEGRHSLVSAKDLMRYTSNEADAFAAVPSAWPLATWRSEPATWENKRKAEARIATSRAPNAPNASRGANTVPLAICAALLAVKRTVHRSERKGAA